MLFDSHLHTNFSEDSHTTLKEYIFRASELGIGLTVTDHYDVLNPGPHNHKPGLPDCDQLFREYGPLRSKSLCIGIELGMELSVTAENRRIAEAFEWDYVIGSLHVLDGMNMYFWDLMCGGRTQQEIYDRYSTVYAETLKQHDFVSSVGHIDHVCRYNSYSDKNLCLEKYGESIEKLFNVMVERDLAVEINTKRFDEKGAQQTILPVLKRFRELGGNYFTVGSDAHNVGMLGNKLKDAYEMGACAGLRPVVFRSGKPEYI